MHRVLPLLAILSFGFAPVPPFRPKPLTKELKTLQGRWLTSDGVEATIEGDRLSLSIRRDPGGSFRLKLDSSTSPKSIDLTQLEGKDEVRTIPCIYILESDELKLCYGTPGQERPLAFETNGVDCGVITFKRMKP
jgi:uncharacterized protein (TIGR03067 family)